MVYWLYDSGVMGRPIAFQSKVRRRDYGRGTNPDQQQNSGQTQNPLSAVNIQNQRHIAQAYDLERLQRYDLALQEVQRALDLDPRSAEAHACGAWILRQQGRLDAAEEAVQSALSINHMLATAHNVRALILWSKGRLLEAEDAFETAIAIAGGGSDAALYITNYARMMLAMQRPDDALALANRALALAPSRSSAHEVRGEALRRLGENDQAIEALRDALRLDPRNARAHNSLGLTQLARVKGNAKGNVDDAQDSFREALRLQPGDRAFQANLVSALQAQNPSYGRLLAFTMRTRTIKGGVYFAWVWAIVVLLLMFLPFMRGVVYGERVNTSEDIVDSTMIFMVTLLTLALLVMVGWLITQPFFNFLLRLDHRNRGIVRFEAVDRLGVALLFAALLSLLAYVVLLVFTGPFSASTLLALQLCPVSLVAILLSGGLRRLNDTIAVQAVQRRIKLLSVVAWASYILAIGSLYALAASSALDLISSRGMEWAILLFVAGAVVYGILWLAHWLDARKVSTAARLRLLQYFGLLGAFIFVGFFTTLWLGEDAFTALLVGSTMLWIGMFVISNRAMRRSRLYRRWTMRYGELSAQRRMAAIVLGAYACLAAIFIVFR
jgi:tetratricopeptide (TPR) repeat protein